MEKEDRILFLCPQSHTWSMQRRKVLQLKGKRYWLKYEIDTCFENGFNVLTKYGKTDFHKAPNTYSSLLEVLDY